MKRGIFVILAIAIGQLGSGWLLPLAAQEAEKTADVSWLLTSPYRQMLSPAGENMLQILTGQQVLPAPQPGAVTAPAPGLHRAPLNVLVNDPGADPGASTTQSEVSMAVSDATGTIIASWNDSGEFGRNGNLTGYGRSTDSGAGWADLGAFPPIPNGAHFGDPSVAVHQASGDFFVATLAAAPTGRSFIGISKSTDDGLTFLPQVDASPGTSPNNFQDKEIMAIDNTGGPFDGNIYIAWTEFGPVGVQIVFSRSTDGGATFSAPFGLNSVNTDFTSGAFPVVAPNGDLFVFWENLGIPGIEFVKSSDGGTSFTAPQSIVTLTPTGEPGPGNFCGRPALNGNIRTQDFPRAAIDFSGGPHHGNIYVVYNAKPSPADESDIFMIRSTDGGATWSGAIRVNDDATTNGNFFPEVAVNDAGIVSVSWYDRRNSPDNLEMQYMRAISVDGGISFAPNQLITDLADPGFPPAVNFDPIVAGCYMGEYNWVVSEGSDFLYVWGDNRNLVGNRNDADIFFARFGGQDSIPPAPITDLSVTGTGSNFATLSWTATGDDSLSGKVAVYDIRYSTAGPIDENNFAAATRVPNPPRPQEAGSTEQFTVTGLDFSTTYHFALRALDDFGQSSGVSNSVSAVTLGTPDIFVTPDSLSAALLTGGTEAQTLSIGNDGADPSTLEFTLPGFAAMELLKRPGIAKNDVSNRGVTHKKLQKGEIDDRKGSAVVLGAGGPDNFGYTWIDSDEPGGPSFDWIDISATGINSGIQFDDQSAYVNLGFRFSFYGNTFEQIMIGENGELSFIDYGFSDFANQPIPSPFDPNNLIAPFWTDHLIPNGGTIYYETRGTAPNRQFIVQWDRVTHISDVNSVFTYQIILSERGNTIKFQYLEMTGQFGDGSFSTVGIENAQGDDGLQVSFNTPYVHDSLAVLFAVAPQFLSVSPASGVVPFGQSVDLSVTFDATGLSEDSYRAEIEILSNDPDEARVIVPAGLSVTNAPDILIAPASLDFDTVFIGTTKSQTLAVTNIGFAPLNVSSIVSNNPDFTVDITSFRLDAGVSGAVQVTFAANATGSSSGALTLSSDDPDDPVQVIPLAAFGLEPPVIAVTPDSLSDSLFTGESSTHALTIDNSAGASNLRWEISLVPVNGDRAARYVPERPLRWAGERARWQAPAGTPLAVAPATLTRQQTLPVIIDDPAGDADIVDVTRVRAQSSATELEVEMEFATPLDPNNFAGFLSLDTDQDNTTGVPPSFGNPDQDIGAEFEFTFFEVGQGVVNLFNVVTGEFINSYPVTVESNSIRFAAPLADLGNDDGEMDVTGVLGDFNGPTDWFPDAGHGTIGRLSWLRAEPAGGVIPAGAATGVTITFDAAGLIGGDYLANVLIASNDPFNPVVTVPTFLHVTGAPDIAVDPAALDFGEAFIGFGETLTLLVANAGTDVLTVSDIASDHPDFTATPTTFSVAAGETQAVAVTFVPPAEGVSSGTLTINSDDPDEPTLTIPFTGEGIFPPDISVSPDSLSEDLFTGETAVQTLTIANTGVTVLNFEITLEDKTGAAAARVRSRTPEAGRIARPLSAVQPRLSTAAERAATASPGAQQRPLPANPRVIDQQAEVLVLTTTSIAASVEQVLFNLGIVYDLIFTEDFTTIDFSPYSTIIAAMDGGLISEASVAALANAAADGKLLIMLGGTNLPEFYQGVQDHLLSHTGEQGWTISNTPHLSVTDPAHALAQGLPDTYNFIEPAAAFYMLRIDDPDASVAAINGDGHPALINKTIGSGSLVYFINSPFEFYWQNLPDFEILQTVLTNALNFSPLSWLSLDVKSGSVNPGESLDIAVTFNAAGLFGGDYLADINIASNDPDESLVTVPAFLHVTGAPDIAVTPDTLDYGEAFIGFGETLTLLVANAGTDVLTVSDIASDNPDFTATPTAFSVDPGETQAVAVTFVPPAEGPGSGTLTISSDDPDEPSLTVALTGTGIFPPDISVTPDSLSADLFTGETATQILTIANDGVTNLNFSIEIEEAVAAAVAVKVRPVSVKKRTVTGASPARLMTKEISRGSAAPYENAAATVHSVKGQPLPAKNRLAAGQGALFNVNITTATIDQLDPASGTVLSSIPLPEPPSGGPDGLAYDGKFLYYVNGFGSNTFYRMDPATGSVLATAVIPGLELIDALGHSGKLLYALGFGNGIVYEIDFDAQVVTNQFSPAFIGGGLSFGGNRGTIFVSYFDQGIFEVDPASGAILNSFNSPNFGSVYGLGYSNGLGVLFASNASDGMMYGLDPDDGSILFSYFVDLGSGIAADEAAGLSWLSTDVSSGTVSPGASLEVMVTFDATGLFGGDYDARIQIDSNDPDEARVTVPAHLHVTGAPDIAVTPDSLDYGTAFIGFGETLTLLVKNEGTDVLNVSNIAADNPDFSAAPNSFAVAAGETQAVAVAFVPAAEGLSSGVLTISSDDPDEPAVTVGLRGEGLVAPDVAVTPDSLSDSLFTGDVATHTLTISNSGGSDLVFNISTETVENAALSMSVHPQSARATAPEGSRSATGKGHPAKGAAESKLAPTRRPNPLSRLSAGNSRAAHERQPVPPTGPVRAGADTAILVIQDFAAWGVDMALFVLDNFGVSATVINSSQISGTDFADFDLIITTGDQSFNYYNAISANVGKFEDFVAAGGVVQYQLATQGDNVDIVNGVDVIFGPLENFNNVLLPDHPIVAGLPAVLEGNAANHCVLQNLPPDAVIITETSDSHLPTTVEYSFGRGTVIATGMTWEFLYINNFNSGPMLFNAVAYSLSLMGSRFVGVNPNSGIIPAGGSAEITVTLDATNLLGGTYRADILIESNDPDEPRVRVPVLLDVTGAPNIAVAPDSLNFGRVFVGAAATDSLTIANVGSDTLEVSDITSADSAFAATPTHLKVAPGDSARVTVTFTPVDTGLVRSQLSIFSNDADQPVATIAVNGLGIYPPRIAVFPDSFAFQLVNGDSATADLTIKNNGLGEMNWSARLRNGLAGTAGQIRSRLVRLFAEIGARDVVWKENTVRYRLSQTGEMDGQPVTVDTEHQVSIGSTLEGVRILFANDDWNGFRVELEARGVHTAVYSGIITAATLDTVDALFIDDNVDLTPGEVGAVRDWVSRGGGLLIDGDSDVASYNQVLDGSGISYQNVSNTTGVTREITPHPLTRDVVAFLVANPFSSLAVSDGALDVIRDRLGVPHAAVGRLGLGNVIAVADETLSFSNYTSLGHLAFGLNSVSWLGAPNWLALSSTAGTIAPGDSATVTVLANAKELPAGLYEASIIIRSDDPGQPEVAIPVILDAIVGINDPFANQIPEKFVLMQNYPNPFNPGTLIRYGLPRATAVRIDVFNILGERVVTLLNERQPAGYHTVAFRGESFTSGVYFYRLKAEGFIQIRRMLLIK